jgi:hypothetical protein
MVKDFHPKPYHGEDSRIGAPKTVTIPTRIATDGAEALSFRSKNLRGAPRLPSTPAVSKVGLRHTIRGYRSRNAANTKIPQRPLLATHMAEERNHRRRHIARWRAVRAADLPGPPPRYPQTRAKAPTNATSHSRKYSLRFKI